MREEWGEMRGERGGKRRDILHVPQVERRHISSALLRFAPLCSALLRFALL